jgi:hypothetical protein
MGTEIGQLGGYGFQGVTLGVDGSCKEGKMGSGCHKFREEGEQPSVKTPFCCAITRRSCVSSGNGWDKEEKQR